MEYVITGLSEAVCKFFFLQTATTFLTHLEYVNILQQVLGIYKYNNWIDGLIRLSCFSKSYPMNNLSHIHYMVLRTLF